MEKPTSNPVDIPLHLHPFYAVIVSAATILSLICGYINAIGILSFGLVVTHITGSMTRIPVAAIDKNTNGVTMVVSQIISFFFGCIAAGCIVGSDKFIPFPRYGVPLLLAGALLFICGIMDYELFQMKDIGYLHAFPAVAAGLVTTTTTAFSAGKVRVSHMTGIAVDIGMLIGQYIKFKISGGKKPELMRLTLLAPIWFAFLIGGFIAYGIHKTVRGLTLVIPGIILASFGIGWIIFFTRRQKYRQKVITALDTTDNRPSFLDMQSESL